MTSFMVVLATTYFMAVMEMTRSMVVLVMTTFGVTQVLISLSLNQVTGLIPSATTRMGLTSWASALVLCLLFKVLLMLKLNSPVMAHF